MQELIQDGGYNEGYSICECFWGREPASYIQKAVNLIGQTTMKLALDIGCGDGKNAAYLADQGFMVLAVDISPIAINNAKRNWPNSPVIWMNQNALELTFPENSFDIVVSAGSLHCLSSKNELSQLIAKIAKITKEGGYYVLSSFNNRTQDMSGHADTFSPLLISHKEYLDYFKSMKIIQESDEILEDIHPHNEIPHHHSISRILVQKS